MGNSDDSDDGSGVPIAAAASAAATAAATAAGDEDPLAAERERQEAREAEIAASWSKRTLADGGGAPAGHGARARVHLVGRLRAEDGAVFEDSRERGVPLLLLLGRGSVVPGLDKALMAMRAGERAVVTVAPEGGYGAAGSQRCPVVPGSTALVYEVELLAVEAEGELWELDFGAKMALADERRGRGNELFRGGWYEWAAAEYEQAMRYLVFMAHPTDDEAPKIAEATATVQLNLAAAALRCGREDDAVRHAEKVLALRPDDAKALYRLGQAYTNLNRWDDAADALRRAAAASADDAAAVARVKQEEKRMRERRAREDRQQRRAYARMVGGGGGDDDAAAAEGAAEGGGRLGRLRSAARRVLRSVRMAALAAFVAAVFAYAVPAGPSGEQWSRKLFFG